MEQSTWKFQTNLRHGSRSFIEGPVREALVRISFKFLWQREGLGLVVDQWLRAPLPGRQSRIMSQAIVDPAELRRFAQLLKKFNNDLQERSGALAAQLEHLSQTWRDQENKKFTEEFHQHLRLLARFIETNNQHIPYLLRKAERIDEYLQQR